MNKLWVRLTLAFVLVTLVMAALVAGAVAWSASRQFRGYLSQPEVFARGSSLQTLQTYYEQHGSWDGVDDALRSGRTRKRPKPDNGKNPGPPLGDVTNPPILVADVQGKIVYDDRRARLGQTLNASELSSALPITASDAIAGYVLAATNDFDFIGSPEQRFLDELQRSVILAALGAVALGVVLGLLVSRSLSKPLATLAQAAHGFAARDWSQRVPINETRHIAEVSEVASAFNNMADSLQQSDTQRRNLMADVAHELRTPLTVIQGLLRALLDGVHPLQMTEVATIYDETRLLSRLVDDVRELALAEARQLPLVMQSVDVSALLRTTANRFAAAADAQNITVMLDVPTALPLVQADRDRAAQVLQNLVSNAFRHTPSGGRVTLAAQAQDKHVVLSVSDTGEGIDAADLPHVFDRFWQKRRDRGERGMG